jgi:hypothetical protein
MRPKKNVDRPEKWLVGPGRSDRGGSCVGFGVGVLDTRETLPAEAHSFTRSKQPWVTLLPGIPTFETVGDPQKSGAPERIGAVFAKFGQKRGPPPGAYSRK